MRRWVLHIDMDAFFSACEQLTRPTLRDRPVLVGGVRGRGVVAGASYEARQFGAHSAMPMHHARSLIGWSAVVVTPRRVIYSTASKRVFEIVAREAGVIEQLSIDEAFLEPAELAGATVAEVREWGEQLRRVIREETGLAASIGAGSGKQYAKISSDKAKPDGLFILPIEEQQEVLGPMPAKALWGVGPVTEAKLQQIGIHTIADLAGMSHREVEISLGSTVGTNLWQLARGIDDRPVAQRAESKQISAEYTYQRDLSTRAEVDAAVDRAAQAAHRRLLIDGRASRTVSVKLRMADFHIESRSATLGYATDELDTLRATAFRLVRYPDELGPIRLVGVSFSGLESARQDVLFPELDRHIAPKSSTAMDDDFETGVSDHSPEPMVRDIHTDLGESHDGWHATQDVYHPEFGHGWVQGTGHGIISVRFETRATGPGKTKTFQAEDPDLQPADPLASLAWEDWLEDQEAREDL